MYTHIIAYFTYLLHTYTIGNCNRHCVRSDN